MPIVRYQIRNEYGLADPELYGAADKEDPEALLEGVAMAGLVGVLRQLGDLAEFAAEIFHNLHEEVMVTAARGHALMLRVQQLEVDFPAIERGFPSQNSHSQLSYNAGVDWHPNLQIDQNLITREDMPRFILDSYEESRGPPRLFMLDKFDIAGDGACLKRYSDPSFFKMDFATSGKMEPDVQREKRSRKNKKKVQRWRNGETLESYITPHVNPKLEHAASEKAPENPPIKRVKLKTRRLTDNTSIRRSYIDHVVGNHSPELADSTENPTSHSRVRIIDSTELSLDVREVIMDTSVDRLSFRERNQTKPYNKEELSLAPKGEGVSDIRDNQNKNKGLLHKSTGEVERLPPTYNKADQNELFAPGYKREGNDNAESRTNGSLDGCGSDDAASELDNYLDALTTMDSEIETDNEMKAKLTPSLFSKEHYKMDPNVSEERELLIGCLGSQMFGESSTQNSLSNKRTSSPPNEDSLNSLPDPTPSHETSGALPGIFIDPETHADETHDINLQIKVTSELLGEESSVDLIQMQITPDVPTPLSESGVESMEDKANSELLKRVVPDEITPNIPTPLSESGVESMEDKANSQLLEMVVPNEVTPDIPTLLRESGVESMEDKANNELLGKVVPKQITPDITTPLSASVVESMGDKTNSDLLGKESSMDISFENKMKGEKSELLGQESSIDLVPTQMTPNIPLSLDESGTETFSYYIRDTAATHIYTSLHPCPEDTESFATNQNILSSSTSSTEKSNICFDGDYTPPVSSDVLGAVEDINGMLSNPVEGHREVGKPVEEDFHQISDESKINSIAKDDYVNPGHSSENTEIFSDASWQLGDESGLDLQIQDDSSLEIQVAVSCVEEPRAEGIMSMSSVSDAPQIMKATNLGISSPMCTDDSQLPLSLPNGEVLHGSMFQGPEVDSGGNTSPGKQLPIFLLDDRSSISIPDDLSRPVDNSVLSDEKFEFARSTAPEDAADPAERKDVSPENTGCFAENEVMSSGITSVGSSFDMKVPQESCNLIQVEFTQNGELPDTLIVLPDVPNYEIQDSFLGKETRDAPSPSGEDHVSLLTGMIPFNSVVEVLPAESLSHSVSECEADELFSATMNSKDSSNNANLEENHFLSDSVSEQQKLEVTEASCLKDLVDLDVQKVPGTTASQEEYFVVTDSQYSAPAESVSNSSSTPDHGECNHICCTEPFKHAQEDLYPADGHGPAVSFMEVEDEEVLSSILHNESNYNNSNMVRHLGKMEASNSDDLTDADNHQTSKIAFSGLEESDAVGDSGDSKSAGSIHDAFEHVEMKPVISVACQRNDKTVVSPQDTRTEERLLESSDASVIDSVKDAEVMRPLEVNEIIEYPLESKRVSHSRPLSSSEPWRAANSGIYLSDGVITESGSPLKDVFTSQSSNESNEISLLQKFRSLNLSDIQIGRKQSREQDDNFTKTESQPSLPEAAQDSVEAVNSHKIYQSDITSEKVSNQLGIEADSSLQSSFEIPMSSAISNTYPASVQAFPSLGASSTVMIQQESSEFPLDKTHQQSSELPSDKDPPLPPLPPLQWRMGKLRPSSVVTNGEMTMPQSGLNNLTTLPSFDHSGGSLMAGAAVQPSNPFLQIPMHPNDSGQLGYQILEEERMYSFQSSGLPPAVEDKKLQDDMLALDAQMEALPSNPSSVVSHVENDQQRNEPFQEALNGVPHSLIPFTSRVELSNVKHEHFHAVTEGDSVEPPKASASPPSLVYAEPMHGAFSLETTTVHPLNPFLSSTFTEGKHYQYDYGEFVNRTVHHLDYPDSLPTADTPQGFLISQVGTMQTFESASMPTAEHRPNGRPRSLLNRPRDPLIEAVASHDKSTLRRVSELVRPSVKPEGERNTLLEQIRNKSFNLKPAAVAKPSIKGPPTNLKVAAILEKANAIRQAVVGSDDDDDDDDGDSWSDS